MDSSNLKLRHQTYYARLTVPTEYRTVVGKSELVRSLHTHDIKEANRRKHAALAAMQAEITRVTMQASLPPESAVRVLNVAKTLRAEVDAKQITQGEAAEQLGYVLDDQIERIEQKYGRDEHGESLVPDAHVNALQLAQKIIRDGNVGLIGECITKYCKETAKRVTAQTLTEKRKHLLEFADYVGIDTDVSTITKRIAGAYVGNTLMNQGHAPSTTKDTIMQLSAFWSWLDLRGYVEANIWANQSKSVKGSTRGKKKTRRPWKDEEALQLVKGLPAGDPLLPMSCIAIYTGMRIEEIACLRVIDVVEGALEVVEGKTNAALRMVPIHPNLQPVIHTLVETSTDGYLIPGLIPWGPDSKRSHNTAKRFRTARVRLGLDDDGLVFHTLRNSFIQRCERTGVPESSTKLLVGHSRVKDITFGIYSDGPGGDVLTQAVGKVTYGALDAVVASLGDKVRVKRRTRRMTKRKA